VFSLKSRSFSLEVREINVAEVINKRPDLTRFMEMFLGNSRIHSQRITHALKLV